jgi:hypothetical protein
MDNVTIKARVAEAMEKNLTGSEDAVAADFTDGEFKLIVAEMVNDDGVLTKQEGKDFKAAVADQIAAHPDRTQDIYHPEEEGSEKMEGIYEDFKDIVKKDRVPVRPIDTSVEGWAAAAIAVYTDGTADEKKPGDDAKNPAELRGRELKDLLSAAYKNDVGPAKKLTREEIETVLDAYNAYVAGLPAGTDIDKDTQRVVKMLEKIIGA